MNQIANSFDRKTVRKMLRSAIWAFIGGLTAALTSYQQSHDVEAALITGLLTMLVPLSVNSGYQFNKGVK
jgi:hypothetical protein